VRTVAHGRSLKHTRISSHADRAAMPIDLLVHTRTLCDLLRLASSPFLCVLQQLLPRGFLSVAFTALPPLRF
jgi:hypothetical protein